MPVRDPNDPNVVIGRALGPADQEGWQRVTLDIETVQDAVAIEIHGVDLSNEVDRTAIQIRGAEPEFVVFDEITNMDGPAWDQIRNHLEAFERDTYRAFFQGFWDPAPPPEPPPLVELKTQEDLRMAARYVQVANHDATHYDFFAIPDTALPLVRRFNVLVPKDLTEEDYVEVAQNLATYVRLAVKPEPEVYFDRRMTLDAIRRFRAIDAANAARAARPVGRAAEAVFDYDYNRRLGRHAYDNRRHTMEPDAPERARRLLKEIDSRLHDKVYAGKAFYFFTAEHAYIWYPNTRAIVDLTPEGPKYVCIHSRDNTVEQNTYDWAITMRTYLLGDEKTWRDKANFHDEYQLRDRNAHPNIVHEP